MAAFEVPENPEYMGNIRKFEVNDPGHARSEERRVGKEC